MCEELTKALIARKRAVPGLRAVLVTDPVNTVYGGQEARHLRRLEEAGTSFREISDRLRAQAAHRLLQQQDLSMAEASRQLGFSDVRAFRRACKRWLGRTPGQVRQTAPDG